MDHTEGTRGRVFILRLYGGEILHESVERFAKEMNIDSATVIAVGGADEGSKLTTGPSVPVTDPIVPTYHVLEAPHELTGTGTIFLNDEGHPIMHMHCSCGREGGSVTGCARSGVKVWLVMEVVISEILCGAKRVLDESSGFQLLKPNPEG